jgi:hypothetical protein
MSKDRFLISSAAERYMLDEMSDEERIEYEAHFFMCDQCTEELMWLSDFMAHARDIFVSESPISNDQLD